MSELKIVSKVTNLILLVLSVGLIAAGSVNIHKLESYKVTESGELRIVPIFAIIVGILSGVLHSWGVRVLFEDEYRKWLAASCFVSCIVHFTLAGMAFNQINSSHDIVFKAIKKILYDVFKTYKQDSKSRMFFDDLQYFNDCCGVVGPKDYGTSLPTTCCQGGETCTEGSSALLKTGCSGIVNDYIKGIVHSTATLVIFIALFEILIIALILGIIREENKEKERKKKWQPGYGSTDARFRAGVNFR